MNLKRKTIFNNTHFLNIFEKKLCFEQIRNDIPTFKNLPRYNKYTLYLLIFTTF